MPAFEAESYRELEVYVYKVSSARYHSSALRLNSSYTVLLHEFRQRLGVIPKFKYKRVLH
jgi:hypothetical protein